MRSSSTRTTSMRWRRPSGAPSRCRLASGAGAWVGCAKRCASTTSIAGPASSSASSRGCRPRQTVSTPTADPDPVPITARASRAPGHLILDPTLRQLLRNAGWLLISDATVLVAGLLGTLVTARALGTHEFGRLTLAWSVVGVAHLLVDVRAWEAVTRYLSEFVGRRQPGLALATLKLAILVEASVAALGFGLVWLTGAWVAPRFFGDPSLGVLIVVGALTLIASVFDRTARAVLRVFDRFRALTLCSTLEAVGRLLLVVAAVAAGARAKGVLLAHVAADLIGALMLLAFARQAVSVELWPARAHARLATVRPYW